MARFLANLFSGPPQSSFVQESPLTLAQLHSLYPPTAGNQFMYARVSDLFSETATPGGVMINETGGHWKPIRTNLLGVMSGNQDMTLNSLRTPPQIILTGAISLARTITMGTQYTYPGQQYIIRRNATGLLGVILNGLGISLGLNGWAIVQFDGTNWQTVASSGLL